MSSVFRVAKKLSATALSQQSPDAAHAADDAAGGQLGSVEVARVLTATVRVVDEPALRLAHAGQDPHDLGPSFNVTRLDAGHQRGGYARRGPDAAVDQRAGELKQIRGILSACMVPWRPTWI
jgi:hypothetical protein